MSVRRQTLSWMADLMSWKQRNRRGVCLEQTHALHSLCWADHITSYVTFNGPEGTLLLGARSYLIKPQLWWGSDHNRWFRMGNTEAKASRVILLCMNVSFSKCTIMYQRKCIWKVKLREISTSKHNQHELCWDADLNTIIYPLNIWLLYSKTLDVSITF